MDENTTLSSYQYYSEEIDASVYLVGVAKEYNFRINSHILEDPLYKIIGKQRLQNLFRGTSMERLPLIIKNGIDNEKPNQGFWGNSSLSKCLEYGEVILCYDRNKVKSSWREIELDKIDEQELEQLKSLFLSHEVSKTKEKIFFSMFDEERRGRVHYERAHGYHIPKPDKEKDCLEAIVLLGSGKDWISDLVIKFYMSGGTLQKDGNFLIDKEKLARLKKISKTP